VELVFGVRLDEAHRRALGDQGIVMNGAETDPGARRDRITRHTS
jgi:hypothetical protein